MKTYFLQVSGIRFAYDSTLPLDQRIVGDVLINGNLLDKNKVYTLALVDWHYEEYVRKHSPLSYQKDGRVTKLK